jgi:hypothetical protein
MRYEVTLANDGWTVAIERVPPEVEPDWPIWISFEKINDQRDEPLGLTVDEARELRDAVDLALQEANPTAAG